jgi:hypothetical protein
MWNIEFLSCIAFTIITNAYKGDFLMSTEMSICAIIISSHQFAHVHIDITDCRKVGNVTCKQSPRVNYP